MEQHLAGRVRQVDAGGVRRFLGDGMVEGIDRVAPPGRIDLQPGGHVDAGRSQPPDLGLGRRVGQHALG
ncbi:hypothetical protein ACFQWF_04015 [Methylorubrum suomiense]